MPRKMYSCDFETTTKVEDCRVWAYGYMNMPTIHANPFHVLAEAA